MLPQINYDKKLLGKLKSNYFNAKVYYEMVKEQEEEIQRKILAENEFYEAEDVTEMKERRGGSGKTERILEPFDTYMMDLDNEFPRFLDLCYPEYVKAGIADPRGKEWCCDAQPRELYNAARKMLVDYAIELVPYDDIKETLRKSVQNIKWRDEVLDLILRLESEGIESYV